MGDLGGARGEGATDPAARLVGAWRRALLPVAKLPDPATAPVASGGRFQLHARAAASCLGAAFFALAMFARFRRFRRFQLCLYLKAAPSSFLDDSRLSFLLFFIGELLSHSFPTLRHTVYCLPDIASGRFARSL